MNFLKRAPGYVWFGLKDGTKMGIIVFLQCHVEDIMKRALLVSVKSTRTKCQYCVMLKENAIAFASQFTPEADILGVTVQSVLLKHTDHYDDLFEITGIFHLPLTRCMLSEVRWKQHKIFDVKIAEYSRLTTAR